MASSYIKSSSYVFKNFDTLIAMRHMNSQRRNFVILSAGNDLINAFCELFWNILKFSTPDDLQDNSTFRLIKKKSEKLGIFISSQNSNKMKRRLLVEDRALQNLALYQCLGGFEFYIENNNNNNNNSNNNNSNNNNSNNNNNNNGENIDEK